jgi:hypothetical protein
MAVSLSERTVERLAALFDGEEQLRVRALLEEQCGDNLPLWRDATPVGLERIRFAVLELSGGAIGKLLDALARAQTDWRDVLVAAGFAERIDAHLLWRPGSDPR